MNNFEALRDYQKEDVQFLLEHPAAALFNEQRTGKTPTALTSLQMRSIHKFVVVCPKSVIYQWEREIKNWCNVPVTVVAKKEAIANWEDGALILSYGMLKSTKIYTGLLEEVLHRKPQAVLIDEAHRIKDRTSANAKAVFQLTKVPIRIALTGTPAPNKPEEIWSILHFLDPKTFRSYWHFIEIYFKTFEMHLSSHNFTNIIGVKPSMKVALQQQIAQYATSRKRIDVMPWLPKKEYEHVKLQPTKQQVKYLTELEKFFETEHVITQTVLDRIVRYRQICVDPAILNLRSKSPKTEWIKDFVSDYPDKPTIIFSKFTSYLKRLSEELEVNHGLIIGETPLAVRDKVIKEFQDGTTNLILINIDAGKEGLTLDRAQACVFTDVYPPVGDIAQAEDRGVTTTQERADKPYTIYQLILKNTYDETLYELVEKRASSIECINNFKKEMMRIGC